MPDFDFKLIFENDFFLDEYAFECDKHNKNLYRQVKYNINKNNEFIGSIIMEDFDLPSFMDKFISIIDDHDIDKLYSKNVKEPLFEKYSTFINSFETQILRKPNNMLGEIYKMRRVAGLIKS